MVIVKSSSTHQKIKMRAGWHDKQGREGVVVRAYACLLGVLSAAFAGRVFGQLLVAVVGVEFLPPMDAWYSGLIPYPALLTSQLVIVALQIEISRELWVGRGAASVPRPVLGRALAWASLVYFLMMAGRYLVTRLILSEAGQFGDTIPIVFHWVLAAYLWVFSRHLRGRPFFGHSLEPSCPS